MLSNRYFCQILVKPKFAQHKFENSSNIKIRPAGPELIHADQRTDRHNEDKSRLSQMANAPNKNEDNKDKTYKRLKSSSVLQNCLHGSKCFLCD
jgi:hypothetical protein